MTSIYSAPSPSLSAVPSRSASRNGTYPARPPIDRFPSTLSDTPVATNSVVNKAGSAASSLYQNCKSLLARLYRVPGFPDRFIDDDPAPPGTPAASALADGNDGLGQLSSDPVSRSLHSLRLGSSLCYLFNALGLAHQLDVSPAATRSNLKACQRCTAHFIMACKQDLHWADSDLFAIHELYNQDTNGVVKVINTVTKLLDRLEQHGILSAPAEEPLSDHTATPGPSDERSMVVREILDSERKYVQDLEVLQDYQRQVQANDIITQDQIHNLFLNLNSLADFQRRFLIGVEANASLPSEQQHFGQLFLTMEDNFSVYEPYCANLTAAQELAINENAALSKLAHILDPVSELSPLLIKPVQRICKYPLLLHTLLKNTPENSPAHAELALGHASSERVTARVNETTRREDNRLSVVDLQRRVEDWKGHDIGSFGELLLRETFFVIKSDSEREYNVYLFERIILCCKESGISGKKSSKSNSILKRPPSRRPASLQLKGRIFVNNVTAAQPVSRNGQYLLEVRWRGDVAEEAFTIKCRTEELLKQWQRTIQKAVDENPGRRRAHHLSNGRRSDRGYNSPLSQFPGTPLSEAGPSNASFYSHQSQQSDYSAYPYANAAQPSYPPHSNGFDDEGDDLYEVTESGRSTPSILARRGPSTRSLPAGERDDRLPGRPRAQTEDSSSAVINQWRNQTPTDSYPGGPAPIPSIARGGSHISNGSESQSLRSSASSKQLRSKASAEWSHHGITTTSPASSFARLPMGPDDEMTVRQGASSRQTSSGSLPPTHPPQPPPLSMRNRSTSSPNMYQGSPLQDHEWNPYSDQLSRGANTGRFVPPSVPALNMSHKGSGATSSAGTLASATTVSTSKKRFSSSSNGTDRSSGTSSQFGGQPQTAATSPSTTLPGSLPLSTGLPSLSSGSKLGQGVPVPGSPSGASAVRVKVTYGDDTFAVVVLSSVSYRELLDKVLKKIRLCGDRSAVDISSLRLRYQDEDGDKILITSEEDVAMAFEAVRAMNTGPNQTLVLFATVDV